VGVMKTTGHRGGKAVFKKSLAESSRWGLERKGRKKGKKGGEKTTRRMRIYSLHRMPMHIVLRVVGARVGVVGLKLSAVRGSDVGFLLQDNTEILAGWSEVKGEGKREIVGGAARRVARA